MRCYKIENASGELVAIGFGEGGIEISEEECNRLDFEIQEKAVLVDALYSGEITIADVPTEWQEEIQRRVDERIAQQGAAEDQELSAEEALDIILGGETA